MIGQYLSRVTFARGVKQRHPHRPQRRALRVLLLLTGALLLVACGEDSTKSDPALASEKSPPASFPSKPLTLPALSQGTSSPEPGLQAAGLLANLQPATPDGWDAPLVLSNSPVARTSTAVVSEEDIYINWAIANQGSWDATSQFFVDLYLDGVPVERWAASQLQRDGAHLVEGWTYLPLRANLTPGTHTLMLMVDPTNLISEEEEADNSYITTFEWPSSLSNASQSSVAPGRFSNLTPFVPEGWDSPILVEASTDGGFGVPSIQVAYRNSGLSSIGNFFQAHLYLDGVLAAKFGERGLIAQESIITPKWRGLTDVVNLTPGRHTLTLTLDPTGLVRETSEGDNDFFMEFLWGPSATTGSSVDETPTEAPKAATLAAFTPPGWGGPIVATNTAGQLASPARLHRETSTYIHWALRNAGEQDLNEPFTVELRLDGTIMETWRRKGLPAGEIDFLLDWPLPPVVQTVPGSHNLELRVRRSPAEAGATVTTTLAQRTVQWVGADALKSDSIRYTAEELQSRLSPLERLLSTGDSATAADSGASSETVLAVADAVYYSIYGTSLFDEPLTIHLLEDEEYSQWVAVECRDTLTQLPPGQRLQYQQSCARLEGFSAYTTSWRGDHRIVLRSARPPIQLLATLAHELGHFRQSILNPELENQGDTASLDIQALREAQAYTYQVYFLRVLEQLTGRGLFLYPKLEGYERFVEQRLDTLMAEAQSSEHSRGQLLVWLSLLTDPELRPTRNVLLINRSIHRVAGRRVAPPAGSIGRGGDGFPAGAFAEHQRLGDGVSGQAIGAVGAPHGLAGGVEPGDTGRHAFVHADAAHVIVRRGRHFHRRPGEVDAVVRQAVDDRSEGGPGIGRRSLC